MRLKKVKMFTGGLKEHDGSKTHMEADVYVDMDSVVLAMQADIRNDAPAFVVFFRGHTVQYFPGIVEDFLDDALHGTRMVIDEEQVRKGFAACMGHSDSQPIQGSWIPIPKKPE